MSWLWLTLPVEEPKVRLTFFVYLLSFLAIACGVVCGCVLVLSFIDDSNEHVKHQDDQQKDRSCIDDPVNKAVESQL